MLMNSSASCELLGVGGKFIAFFTVLCVLLCASVYERGGCVVSGEIAFCETGIESLDVMVWRLVLFMMVIRCVP